MARSGEIAARDLFWGPGSAERAPKPPFTFVKEDLDGTKPKVHVVDAPGTSWSVKFDHHSSRGPEVQAEVAATRIVWALGYFVEETYFVEDGVIEKVGRLERAQRVLGTQGRFSAARFERRAKDVERLAKRWSIDDNPFAGSKELSGLLVLVSMLGNWDFRDENTGVMRVKANGAVEDRYLVTDWGTAFGRMGGAAGSRSRWKVRHYRADTPFITRIDANTLELHFTPAANERVHIPIEHGRWIAHLLSALTERQIRQAFAAAGASEAESQGFTAGFLAKVAQLRKATT